ncbi:sensor histidine kinase [Roseateles amylovorans]|uniref:Histidine kinase n=1 Tax=Roseateles amylovorans TaxID=2978473 RepID=A0ABY6AXB8_9BURK|nr:histidine kinase [Roseateles amylovorans]UXH77816.1 histidine kinase [Roseateles amylovorans]
MSSVMPPPVVPARPPTPREAALQLFNLRMIAAIFYFCLAMAGARSLTWMTHDDSLGGWLLSWLQFTRQTMLTALSVLALLALAEAWLARPGHAPSPTSRWPIAVRGGAIALGALIGALLRYWVANLGDPTAPLHGDWMLSTTLLWLLLGATASGVMQTMRAERRAQAELVALSRQHDQLQAQQLEAQLSALNAQIEPHFLFNTLANVKRLYETTPERGRNMLVSLIAYLRAALPSMRQGVSTLGQEMDLARSYLTILQMRMGDRLQFELSADADLHATPLPPMVLPTLVENAIKHGLGPLPEGGRIDIQVDRQPDGALSIEVRDNGQGFVGSGGSGVGLANTRARLAAMYGPQAALELEAAQPRGVVARLRIPAIAPQGMPTPLEATPGTMGRVGAPASAAAAAGPAHAPEIAA